MCERSEERLAQTFLASQWDCGFLGSRGKSSKSVSKECAGVRGNREERSTLRKARSGIAYLYNALRMR